MKNLLVIAALIITNLVSANETNHNFTPSHNIVSKGKTTVYFVTQNPEKYDWVKWDFGDGKTAYSINPAHEYTAVGVYNVKMIVSKGAQVDTICKTGFVTILEKKLTENSTNDEAYQTDNLNEITNLKAKTEKKPIIGFNFENNNLIICNESLVKSSVEIKDLNGNLMHAASIDESQALTTIDINFLKQGMYLVTIIHGKNMTVTKFLKP